MNSIFQFTKRIDLLFKISRIQKFILKRTSLQYKSSVNINSLRKVNFLLFFITKKVYLKRSTMYVDEINQRWFNFVRSRLFFSINPDRRALVVKKKMNFPEIENEDFDKNVACKNIISHFLSSCTSNILSSANMAWSRYEPSLKAVDRSKIGEPWAANRDLDKSTTFPVLVMIHRWIMHTTRRARTTKQRAHVMESSMRKVVSWSPRCRRFDT